MVPNQRGGLPTEDGLEESDCRRVSERTLAPSDLVVLSMDPRDGDVLEAVVGEADKEGVLGVSVRNACGKESQ